MGVPDKDILGIYMQKIYNPVVRPTRKLKENQLKKFILLQMKKVKTEKETVPGRGLIRQGKKTMFPEKILLQT